MLCSDINVRGPAGKEEEDEVWQEPFIFENEMPAALLLCTSVSSQQMSLSALSLPASPGSSTRGWRCDLLYQGEMRQVFPFHDCFYLSSPPCYSVELLQGRLLQIQ